MTLDPKALAVLADALRDALPERDAADVLKWATHPEAVRELLKHTPIDPREAQNAGPYCPSCAIWSDSSFAHRRDCAVVAAWRALGDPRGAEDIERAHEEALRIARQRSDGPHNAPGMINLMASLALANPNPFVAAAELLCGAEINVIDGAHYTHCTRPTGHVGPHESMGGAMVYVRVAAGHEERADLDLEATPDHLRGYFVLRRVSDARGMEAVEAEAWAIHDATQPV